MTAEEKMHAALGRLVALGGLILLAILAMVLG